MIAPELEAAFTYIGAQAIAISELKKEQAGRGINQAAIENQAFAKGEAMGFQRSAQFLLDKEAGVLRRIQSDSLTTEEAVREQHKLKIIMELVKDLRTYADDQS